MANFCRNCGTRLSPTAKFCPACGTQVSNIGSGSDPGQTARKNTAPSSENLPERVSGQNIKLQEDRPDRSFHYDIPKNQGIRKNKTKKSGGKLKLLLTVLGVYLLISVAYAGLESAGIFDSLKKPANSVTNSAQQQSGKPGQQGKADASGKPGSTGNAGSAKDTANPNDMPVLREETAVLDEKEPTATICGVTVNAELLDFAEGSLKARVADQGTGTTAAGRAYHQYDISVGTQHELGSPVELTFPCSDPENHVITHYMEELDSWMPLICRADPEAGTITALNGSFTPIRDEEKTPEEKKAAAELKAQNTQSGQSAQSEGRQIMDEELPDPASLGPLYLVENPGSPEMKYEISSNWEQICKAKARPNLTESMAQFAKSPSTYHLEMPDVPTDGTPEQMISGFEGANSWWGLISPLIDVGVSLTHMEKPPMAIALVNSRFQPYDANFKTQLSNAMTDISLLTMGLQVCTDSYKYGFNSPTTALNAYKNLCTNAGTIFSMHTGYASSALTLGFLGVSIFSMQLDYMVEGAKETQVEIATEIFNSYYENIHPFEWKPWYQFFVDRYWQGDMDARGAMDAVNYKLDEYAGEFWEEAAKNSDDFIFAISESKYRNYFDIPPGAEGPAHGEAQDRRAQALPQGGTAEDRAIPDGTQPGAALQEPGKAHRILQPGALLYD